MPSNLVSQQDKWITSSYSYNRTHSISELDIPSSGIKWSNLRRAYNRANDNPWDSKQMNTNNRIKLSDFRGAETTTSTIPNSGELSIRFHFRNKQMKEDADVIPVNFSGWTQTGTDWNNDNFKPTTQFDVPSKMEKIGYIYVETDDMSGTSYTTDSKGNNKSGWVRFLLKRGADSWSSSNNGPFRVLAQLYFPWRNNNCKANIFVQRNKTSTDYTSLGGVYYDNPMYSPPGVGAEPYMDGINQDENDPEPNFDGDAPTWVATQNDMKQCNLILYKNDLVWFVFHKDPDYAGTSYVTARIVSY